MHLPTTMRALEVIAPAGPEAVRLTEHAVPPPGPGEVLIRVDAAGVNFADVMQTRGTYPHGPQPPYIAGIEACGAIVAVGDGGAPFPVGTQVLALGHGAFAEYMLAPAATVQPLPPGWSAAQGAALFVSWFTALGCVRTFGRLTQGESVLIHAAAGGVGQAAVQLAKHFGARVFASASSNAKLDTVRRLGADECINYHTQDFVAEVKARTAGRGVDLVLESVGGETFRRSFEAIVPCGRLVMYGLASGVTAAIENRELLFHWPVTVIGFNAYVLMQQRPDIAGPMFTEFHTLIHQGVIRPEAPTVHPLAEGGRVLAALENRQTAGKLVLIP
jgi:NADPH2:quinone reductase